MAAENPTWGALRIHGELLKLGFVLSETTVSRWIRRIPRTPDYAKRWSTFLRYHREAIAAMDFFTVPTLTFGVLYCFFVIGHDRRKILCFNVTRNPKALWIVQPRSQSLDRAACNRRLFSPSRSLRTSPQQSNHRARLPPLSSAHSCCRRNTQCGGPFRRRRRLAGDGDPDAYLARHEKNSDCVSFARPQPSPILGRSRLKREAGTITK
jgi:hypothetical protein